MDSISVDDANGRDIWTIVAEVGPFGRIASHCTCTSARRLELSMSLGRAVDQVRSVQLAVTPGGPYQCRKGGL